VVDVDGHAAQVELVAVAVQLDHLLGLAKESARRHLCQPRTEAVDRVFQHEPVLGMDVGGAAVGVGNLLGRPDVIDVAVGEQHRRRGQPVLVEDPPQRAHRTLAGIHDDGVRSGPFGQHVTVALQHSGGKSGDQHGSQFPIPG